MRRGFFSIALAVLLPLGSAAAQVPLQPILAFGPELLETTSPIPGAIASRTQSFAPGLTLLLGLSYQPRGSKWGFDLRASRIRRDHHAFDGCFNSGPDDCTMETETEVLGLSVAARFQPSHTAWLKPYLLAGAGLYHVYHSEPAAVLPVRNGLQLARQTHSGTTPGGFAGAGLQVGRGRTQVFLEATLYQYLGDAPPGRSLPLLIGFRL